MKRSVAIHPTAASNPEAELFSSDREDLRAIPHGHMSLCASTRPQMKRPKLKSYESSILNSQWDAMYASLLEYKANTGNCLVPHRYNKNPALGAWVSTQRRQFKVFTEGRAWTGKANSTPITPYRVSRLNEIGFVWTTNNPIKIPWKRRYQELVEFKNVHGHCLVPSVHEKNIKLGHWVSTQRHQAKALKLGRPTRMTKEHIRALDAIGFSWVAPRGASRIVKNRFAGEEGTFSNINNAVASGNITRTNNCDENTTTTRPPPIPPSLDFPALTTRNARCERGREYTLEVNPHDNLLALPCFDPKSRSTCPSWNTLMANRNLQIIAYDGLKKQSMAVPPPSFVAKSVPMSWDGLGGIGGSASASYNSFTTPHLLSLAGSNMEPSIPTAHQIMMANTMDRALLSGALYGRANFLFDSNPHLLAVNAACHALYQRAGLAIKQVGATQPHAGLY